MSDQSILSDLFGPPATRHFAVRYWDGSIEPPGAADSPAFTLVLNHPGSLARMLLPPSHLSLAEAYVAEDFDVEGDLEAAAGLATQQVLLAKPDLRGRVSLPLTRADLYSGSISG